MSLVVPHAFVICMPCSYASYSASLLEGFSKLIYSMYRSLSPRGDVRTTSAPAPWILFEPSKYMFQELERLGGPGVCTSIHSTRKSGSICALIADRCLYVRSLGLSSMLHWATRPVASGLLSISMSRAQLTIMMGCSRK